MRSTGFATSVSPERSRDDLRSVGADAKEVELGLKSERRTSCGLSVAGRCVRWWAAARDTSPRQLWTEGLADRSSAVRDSNQSDVGAAQAQEQLADLAGRRGILGLTYKPGTSTLRRSNGVSFAQAPNFAGATIIAFDLAFQVASNYVMKSISRPLREALPAPTRSSSRHPGRNSVSLLGLGFSPL